MPTLYDKIWNNHVVKNLDDGRTILYIDKHFIHEVTSPQAFQGLYQEKRKVRKPLSTIAVSDHNVPTTSRLQEIEDESAKIQIETLKKNAELYDIPYIDFLDERQGIVHVIGPEQGISMPGLTIACGDSHTCTHGALGALGFGIGTSEIEHVLATQTVCLKKLKNFLILITGKLSKGVFSKDVILHIIAKIGSKGALGHVLEFSGEIVSNLSIEARMTLCNMSIEAGARSGLVAPDQKTFDYLKNRPFSPKGREWEKAIDFWKTLQSDSLASFEKKESFNLTNLSPQVTWGTSSDTAIPIHDKVPEISVDLDEEKRRSLEKAMEYMHLKSGMRMQDIPVDKVFIGSCTNSRIEDLREAASILKGRKVAKNIHAIVVPGSGLVKKQAESEGIHNIFIESGFEWRNSGCSMCIGMNSDRVSYGERCASTSNRNFEGRQGPGAKTHLMSPMSAAATAIRGKITDPREFL